MTRFSFASLRARLLFLVLLAFLPGFGLTLYSSHADNRHEAAEVQTNTLELARLASASQEQLFEGVHQVLVTLTRLPEVREGDPAACSGLLGDLLAEYPFYALLGVAGPGGNVFCSAVPLSDPVTIADRLYFRRALEQRDFAIGEYQIDRITGRATLNFGHPVLDQTGQVRAVVFAALDLDWLNRFVARAQLPPEATYTVIDRHGTILARVPDPDHLVGQTVPEAPIVEAVLARRDEGTVRVPGPDGIRRLFAFKPLHAGPEAGSVYISIGIPASVAYAELKARLIGNLLGLTLAAVLALEAARRGCNAFILRPVTALVAATNRLSAGDLSARTGLGDDGGEFGRLARAFDAMAGALQTREAERVLAEDRSRRAAARAEALVRVADRLNAQLDLDGVLSAVCEEAAHAFDVPAASLSLYDEVSSEVTPTATFGLPPDYRERVRPLPGALYDEYARRMGPVIVIPDIQALPDLPSADVRAALGIRTFVATSLLRDDRLIGFVNLMTIGEVRHFSEEELGLLPGLANQAAQAISNARLFTEARRRLDLVQALRTIDMAITASLDLRVTLAVLLDQVTTQLDVDAAAVLLLNPYTQILHYAAGRGFRTNALAQTQRRVGEGAAGCVALERRLVTIPDLREAASDFTRAPLLAGEAFIAYYGVPLIAKGQVKGVLELFHRAPLAGDRQWLDFLDALAGQAAIAIDNAALFDELQHSNAELALAYDSTIEGWARALDLRDKETEGHSRRVTELTMQVARALGVSEAELVHVRRGALLHDIGKVGIPDAILLKPGPLSEEEWATMRRHPVYAYELLAPIAYLRPALDIPYCHHEKWDGTGYPRGLKGEQIPLAARIFAVVDVWDALTSDRPYRPAWPQEQAREQIRALSGTHFDPQVVEAFLEIDDAAEPPGVMDAARNTSPLALP